MDKSTFMFILWCFFLMGSVVQGQSDFVPIADAWVCHDNLQPLSEFAATIPLRLGSDIRICIQPTNYTKSRKIVMRSIDRFAFSKGDRGRNGVQEVIRNRQAVDTARTTIACEIGAPICSVKVRLLDDFFFPAIVDGGHELPPSLTTIQGYGAVTMEYGINGGGRRLLRGTINFQRSRQVQDSSGYLAGADEVQVMDIPILEQARGTSGKGGDSGSTGASGYPGSSGSSGGLSDKWKGLPMWAKILIVVGGFSMILCCCCSLAFFGWYAGRESAKRRVQQQQMSPKSDYDDEEPPAPMNGDSSGRTVYDDTSHSPKQYRSSDDSTVGYDRGNRMSTQNPRMALPVHNGPGSLSGSSTHSRSVGGNASVARPSRRHASLGPPSGPARRGTGLSQSQHAPGSRLPRRTLSSSSDSRRPTRNNNSDLSDSSTHSNRPLTRNSYHGPPSSRPGRGGPARQSYAPNNNRNKSMMGQARSEHVRGSNNKHGPPTIRIPMRSDQQARRPPGRQPPPFVKSSTQESDSSSSDDDDDDDDDTGSFASTSTTSETESLGESSRNSNKQPVEDEVRPPKKVAPPLPSGGPRTKTNAGRSISPTGRGETPRESVVGSRPNQSTASTSTNQSTIPKVGPKKKVIKKKKVVLDDPPVEPEEKEEELAWGDQLD